MISTDARQRAMYSLRSGDTCLDPIRIYAGILGQFGDIISFTPALRRLKQIFPYSQVTFAASKRYAGAAELLKGLPYVDRVFLTELYFENLAPEWQVRWEMGFPVDLRGEDEIAEEAEHDVVLPVRPLFKRHPWYEFGHLTSERARAAGIPGPINPQTEIAIPIGTKCPANASGKIVFFNDPSIASEKAWPWDLALQFIDSVGPENFFVLGSGGPEVPGATDLRGKTTFAEAAQVIAECSCCVGIDSGLQWVAASLQKPALGLYATEYLPAYTAHQPYNPNAWYLQVEGAMENISPIDVQTRVKALVRQAVT